MQGSKWVFTWKNMHDRNLEFKTQDENEANEFEHTLSLNKQAKDRKVVVLNESDEVIRSYVIPRP